MDKTTKPIEMYLEIVNKCLFSVPRETYKDNIILNNIKAIFDNNRSNIDVYYIRPNEKGDNVDIELIYNNADLSLSLFKTVEQQFDQDSYKFRDRKDKDPIIKISIDRNNPLPSNIVEIAHRDIHWSFGYFIDPFFDYVVIWTSIATDKNKNGMYIFKRNDVKIMDPRIKELFD